MTKSDKKEAEKAGVRSRVAIHAAKQKELGRLARKFWATDIETRQLREILAAWRHEPTNLALNQLVAAYELRPEKSLFNCVGPKDFISPEQAVAALDALFDEGALDLPKKTE